MNDVVGFGGGNEFLMTVNTLLLLERVYIPEMQRH